MGRSRASIRCYVPVNEKSPFLDSLGGETSWVSLLPFSLLYVWWKALVDERGPVSFLACVNVGEEEEQLVQKKKGSPSLALSCGCRIAVAFHNITSNIVL